MNQLFKDKPVSFSTRPGWCSQELWDTLVKLMDSDQILVDVVFSKAERKVVRKQKPILISEWAEKYRMLTMSVLPGLWHNDVTPYMTGVMDAAGMSYVRELTMCATPQTGKSEVVHNIVGHGIDRAPGPVLYVYPDEKTGKENMQDRILPMIESSPRLKTFLTGTEKDKGAYRISLSHMPIYLGWGRSVASLANKPIKIGVADEIDKDGFDTGKKETSVLKLIDKRFTTYRSVYKFFKLSTPTLETGRIWVELLKCEVIFDYNVRCPLCNMLLLMRFDRDKNGVGGIQWEGGSDADPATVKTRNLAWYQCHHCLGKWDEGLRDRAVRAGVWMSRKKIPIAMMTYLEKFRPSFIGFHIPAWISYFVPFGEIASAFLQGLKSKEDMQDFKNSYCALPWVVKRFESSEEKVLESKNDLPGGVVPQDTIALTCGIDIQLRGAWFVVRAWNRNKDSHLVQYGYLATWDDVYTLVYKTAWPVAGRDPGATPMGIWRTAMDTGGGVSDDGDWSKTEEIYAWIKRYGGNKIFAVKGASRKQDSIVRKATIGMKRKGQPVPGAMDLYHLDVGKLKHSFLDHFAIHPDPVKKSDSEKKEDETPVPVEEMSVKTSVTLHADTGMDYAKQILAEEEREDRHGKKSWVQVRHDNHLLDCEVYAAACADDLWAPAMVYSYLHQQAQTGGIKVHSRGIDGQ